MAHKDRRTYKDRGTRTCGYGSAQKHRGAGSRGGRGMAGSKKHKWSFVSKYLPGYFGRRGFKRPFAGKEEDSINVGYLNDNIDSLVKKGMANLKDKKYSIDLNELGYGKLLGSGKVTRPLFIKVNRCSMKASVKVKDAGGKVETSEVKEEVQKTE